MRYRAVTWILKAATTAERFPLPQGEGEGRLSVYVAFGFICRSNSVSRAVPSPCGRGLE